MMKIFTPTDILAVLEQQPNRVSEKEITQALLGVNNYQSTNVFDIDTLDFSRVYHLETIKRVCIDYRLRFLDLKYFKGALPEAA